MREKKKILKYERNEKKMKKKKNPICASSNPRKNREKKRNCVHSFRGWLCTIVRKKRHIILGWMVVGWGPGIGIGILKSVPSRYTRAWILAIFSPRRMPPRSTMARKRKSWKEKKTKKKTAGERGHDTQQERQQSPWARSASCRGKSPIRLFYFFPPSSASSSSPFSLFSLLF